MAKDLKTNSSPNYKKSWPIYGKGGEHREGLLSKLIWDVRNSLYVDPGRSNIV